MALDTKYVRGADRLQQRIATIRANLNLPAMVEEIGALLLRRTKERFEAETDPDGNRWEPLKNQTLARRQRGGFDGKMLQRTQALKNAIALIKGGAGSTFVNTGAAVRIGIQDPRIAAYARVQQQGLPSKHIPARRFLGIGRLDVKAVDSLLRRKAQQIEDTA